MKAPQLDGAGFAGSILADVRAIPIHGAVERSRTSDLLITNQLLYQLSYNGKIYLTVRPWMAGF